MTESTHRAPAEETAGYDPAAIERKWQERWEKRGTNHTDLAAGARPYYALMMFPYPSAEGLHVGNLFAFTGSDIYGRFQRLQGHTVFEPMGFDAFGIHSENFALKIGTHPADLIPKNIDNFRRQLKRAGLMVDWRHELSTTDPDYYKWTQWVFLELLQARARVQEARGRQLVPERQDRARQRAGHRRRVRALRRPGRAAVPRAVVLPHHRLCGAAARRISTGWTGPSRPNRPSATGSAGPTAPRSRSAFRISRSWPARPRPPSGVTGEFTRADDRHSRLHDAAGHDLRRHLPGARAGASARRCADDGRPAVGRRARTERRRRSRTS